MSEQLVPIQTEYSGVTFRSRSEAMIAALFDMLGLNWLYEPWHLNGWVPDFVIDAKASVDARVAENISEFLPLEIYERTFNLPLGLDEVWLMPNSPIPSIESPDLACWGWRLRPSGHVSELRFDIDGRQLDFIDAVCLRREIWQQVMQPIWDEEEDKLC